MLRMKIVDRCFFDSVNQKFSVSSSRNPIIQTTQSFELSSSGPLRKCSRFGAFLRLLQKGKIGLVPVAFWQKRFFTNFGSYPLDAMSPHLKHISQNLFTFFFSSFSTAFPLSQDLWRKMKFQTNWKRGECDLYRHGRNEEKGSA